MRKLIRKSCHCEPVGRSNRTLRTLRLLRAFGARKDISIRTVVAVIAVCSLGFSEFQPRWDKVQAGLREPDVKKVVIDHDSRNMWILTGRSVYQGQPSGSRYSFKSLSPRISSTINDITSTSNVIYLAADDGLYARASNDYHFKRIFSSSDELQRQCLSVVRMDDKIFLGTRKGLFYKSDAESSWQAVSGELSDHAIERIIGREKTVFILNSTALYQMDLDHKSFKKIFTTGVPSEEDEMADEVLEDVSTDAESEMLDFVIAEAVYYLATKKGIYTSGDLGQSWELMPSDGLPYSDLRRLLVRSSADGKSELLAATAQGVYRYVGSRWQQMYLGLESNDILDLALDSEGRVYAGTSRGLFVIATQRVDSSFPYSSLNEAGSSTEGAKQSQTSADGIASAQTSGLAMTSKKIIFNDYSEIEEYFSFEPSVNDVQDMAIQYAEVHPDKIKQWRRRANLQALAPSLSTGIDRSATDRWHWDTGASPDNLIKGREYLDWDVGLSWNLGELIWNNDQTSIDSRSKLMVELREDVLDQVTRIYFERRRTQIDAITNPALDPNAKIEQQMRLAELTAIIDGFTGGRFSKGMEDRG